MTEANYIALANALAFIRTEAGPLPSAAPLLAMRRPACVVAADSKLHVLRCRPHPALLAGERRPGLIEYGVVDVNNLGAPSWIVVSHDVFEPDFPALWSLDGRWSGVIVGALTEAEQSARMQSYDLLLLEALTGQHQVPKRWLPRLNSAVRVATDRTGACYFLTRGWFPPPVVPNAVPLVLVLPGTREAPRVLAPLPGSDTAGSFPSEAALWVSNGYEVHVLYDGRREPDPAADRLWHVVIAPGGQLLYEEDLGEAPHRLVLLRILRAPSGLLYGLVVFSMQAPSPQLRYRLIRLGGQDAATTQSVYHFVDHYLELHSVIWHGELASYLGPAIEDKGRSRCGG